MQASNELDDLRIIRQKRCREALAEDASKRGRLQLCSEDPVTVGSSFDRLTAKGHVSREARRSDDSDTLPSRVDEAVDLPEEPAPELNSRHHGPKDEGVHFPGCHGQPKLTSRPGQTGEAGRLIASVVTPSTVDRLSLSELQHELRILDMQEGALLMELRAARRTYDVRVSRLRAPYATAASSGQFQEAIAAPIQAQAVARPGNQREPTLVTTATHTSGFQQAGPGRHLGPMPPPPPRPPKAPWRQALTSIQAATLQRLALRPESPFQTNAVVAPVNTALL